MPTNTWKRIFVRTWLVLACAAGCADRSVEMPVLRLAVTTSTRDSGLLDELIPRFQSRYGARVDVIAVGTGAALKLGEAGDVDAVLVHARALEDAFMAAGHGVRREDVMYNSFEILGPPDDPAQVSGLEPTAALVKIAASGQPFVSRGDGSGTHQRELTLWKQGGGRPAWDAYVESGQGMGATLIMADQLRAYALADRGTYLKFKDKIDLVPLVRPTAALRNPYGVIAVNPEKNEAIRGDLAQQFIQFLISPETQRQIRDYRVAGQPLFHPLHDPDQP